MSLAERESAIVRVGDDTLVGTGFFIDAGLIVSCAHVAQSPTVTVRMHDGRTVSGEVVSRAPTLPRDDYWPAPDIALIEVSPTCETPLELAPRDSEVGENLITAGFVVGPEPSPTLTYEHPAVSATEPVHNLRVLKLSDCQLEAGMSGAPLLDGRTLQVVGVVKRSRNVDARVGGWAVPIGALDQHFPKRIGEIRDEHVAELLRVYYAAVISGTETIEPRGMRRSRESQDIVFPMDDVYLSLEMQRYHEADFAPSPGRSSAATSVEPYLGIERVPDAPKLRESSSLSRILAEGQSTVLLGGPGSGKTTLLQWIALHAARARARGRPSLEVEARQIDPESTSEEMVSVTSARLPISVRLADFHERLSAESDAGRELSLRDFLVISVCELADDHGGCLKEYVDQSIGRGEAIVLLDGMDELRDMSDRKEVRDAIDSFVSGLTTSEPDGGPGSRLGIILPRLEETGTRPTILVTSRHAGYRDAALPIETFEHGLVAPLSDGAVRRFLFNWNLAVRKWSRRGELTDDEASVEAQERTDSIDAQLNSSPNLRAIARTPLLLTVITLVHEERNKLPQMRTELLMQMGEILVERRETDHRFPDAADLLGPVALWLHKERATGLLTKNEFNELVREDFGRVAISSPDGATPVRAMVDRFCADAEEQFGLIVERGSGLVGFQHRMLQEFFAAFEITSWPKDPFGAIEAHLFDPQWREVIIFVAHLEARKGAQSGSSFMARLLEAGADGGEQVERQRQALFLAADCLVEINRSLLEIEVKVIEGIIELVCTGSTLAPNDGIGEAIGRLRTIARLFPETTDAVLTRVYLGAEVRERRTLCEIAIGLGIGAPGLRRALERQDGKPGVCLAERIALLVLRGDPTGSSDGDLSTEVPEWIRQTHRRLTPFGDSAPLQTLKSIEEAIGEGGEEAKDRYRDALLSLLESRVGIDATLAGIALTTVRPDAMSTAFTILVGRSLLTEAADLFIWSAGNTQLASDVLEHWGELDPAYRGYVLALLARDPNRQGARDVAWAEVEFATTEEGQDVRPSDSLHLLSATSILLATPNLKLSASQFEWLDELAASDPGIEATVAFVFSDAGLRAGIEPQHLQAQSPPGLHFLTVLMAENGDLSENVLLDIARASDHPSGVWGVRTARALRKSRPFSALSGRVVRALETIIEAATLPRTNLMFEGFLTAVEMDVPAEVDRLLAGETSASFFNNATTEVDALLVRAAASDEAESEHAVGGLNERRSRDGVKGLPLLEPTGVEVRQLVTSADKDPAVLGGALLARAVLESDITARQAIKRIAAEGCRAEAALELCFWVSEHQLSPGKELEEIAAEVIGSWAGEVGIAMAARLLATTHDNGLAFFSEMNLEAPELIEAILIGGDHPIIWTTDADSPTLRGLSALLGTVTSDTETFDATVAICAETLGGESDWPKARFTLHQLVELGGRAPDGFRVAALKHGLVAPTASHLVSPESFGVRARAFVVLARIGHFDEEMFDALIGGALDINEVSTQIFGSLRLIRSVDDAVFERIQRSLESEGVEAIAALDAALQLLHSYALDGDSVRRRELVDMLVHATSVCSPWAVCRLPSGLGVQMRSSMARAVLRVMTNTDQVGEIRPIMVTVPQAGTPPPSSADAKRSFVEQFLAHARQYLKDRRRDDA
jgi:hypothetical protein